MVNMGMFRAQVYIERLEVRIDNNVRQMWETVFPVLTEVEQSIPKLLAKEVMRLGDMHARRLV
jgi:hypothetical protein